MKAESIAKPALPILTMRNVRTDLLTDCNYATQAKRRFGWKRCFGWKSALSIEVLNWFSQADKNHIHCFGYFRIQRGGMLVSSLLEGDHEGSCISFAIIRDVRISIRLRQIVTAFALSLGDIKKCGACH